MLTHYKAIEQTSARMAAAAQQGCWVEVERLQAVARDQVASLKAKEPMPLTPAERQARLAALKAILRLDAQVRNLAEPGWIKIHEWLQPSNRGQIDAYFEGNASKLVKQT